jgi:NADH-quinone oxidoreductase subunit D
MSNSTTEIEAPDTISRAARAAEGYHAEADDLVGERMVLNMGPSHPATHGVLRLVLELDGEIIAKADPDVGFLHRGDEKIAENMHYNQFVPYTDRLDYLAPLANNVAYACASRNSWAGRCRRAARRCACCAANCPHFLPHARRRRLRHGCRRDDRVPLHLHRAREDLQPLRTTHRRAFHHLLHPRRRPTPRHAARLRSLRPQFLTECEVTIGEISKLLDKNKIFLDRMVDVGVISRESPSPTA